MKNVRKKIWICVMILVLVANFFCISVQTAEAASKPAMKKVNVSWDLEPDIPLTYKSYYDGIGLVKQKAKMINYKVEKSDVEGYNICSFTIKYTRKWKVKKTQVNTMVTKAKNLNNLGGCIYFTTVDYNTGKCLKPTNKQGVKVTKEDWSYSDYTYYYGSYKSWVRISNASVNVEITYPETYKGLCIGIGGKTSVKDTANEIRFQNGRAAFDKASKLYSTEDKKVAHFMRVR